MMKEEMKRLGFADILNEEKVPIEQSGCIPCAEARQKPPTTTE
jgi:hypothetical protein